MQLWLVLYKTVQYSCPAKKEHLPPDRTENMHYLWQVLWRLWQSGQVSIMHGFSCPEEAAGRKKKTEAMKKASAGTTQGRNLFSAEIIFIVA